MTNKPKDTISSLLQLFRENKSGGYLCSDKFNNINKYIMSIFAGKTLMITGGTGSFGNAALNRFLRTDIGEIRIFPVMRRSRMTCVTSIK